MSKQRLLNYWDLWRMFFRSFFIQAVWNYHSLLSIGFCFTLVPAANRIFKDKSERIKFLCRHLNFFNAHPYFASFAIGAVVKAEEEQQVSQQSDPGKVERLKNALIGPLGAIGDQVFWANIKPSSVLVAVLGILIFKELHWQLAFLGFMLLIYNIPHFFVRFAGISKGYQLGFEVYKVLNLDEYMNLKRLFGAIGAIALGSICGFSLMKFGQIDWLQGIMFLGSAAAAYYIWKWRQNFYQAVLLSLLAVLVLSLVMEVL
jgi:mannose/fructose/N-acetylgalactosamine-specific phosphotransferase system component IID